MMKHSFVRAVAGAAAACAVAATAPAAHADIKIVQPGTYKISCNGMTLTQVTGIAQEVGSDGTLTDGTPVTNVTVYETQNSTFKAASGGAWQIVSGDGAGQPGTLVQTYTDAEGNVHTTYFHNWIFRNGSQTLRLHNTTEWVNGTVVSYSEAADNNCVSLSSQP